MIETDGTLRNWGRSIGLVIPKETLREKNLQAGDEVEIMLRKKENPLKKLWGQVNDVHINTQQVLDELDREAWDD